MRMSVTQEDPMGCGAACVAFVTNQSYSDIALKLGRDKAHSFGFYLKELHSLLSELGFLYEGKYVKPKIKNRIYEQGAIVFIKRSSKYPEGHYLIRFQEYWMDPWINFTSSTSIENAKSGFRKRLPGKAQWVLLPKK
jgi:hypothetical protein